MPFPGPPARAMLAALVALLAAPLSAQDLCAGYGPQAPRDITSPDGDNARQITLAPPAAQMNLCNIHAHRNAEHRGPDFRVVASADGGTGEHGGFACDAAASLTPAELADPGHGAFHDVKPGDTIEVHWVFTSCAATPGEGLGSCFNDTCANPELRVESQVFLLVNDPTALDFTAFDYAGPTAAGLHQPAALPDGTGTPVTFAGSTTGPAYADGTCSPYAVTWSVRPACARLDITSLHRWAEAGNVFNETHPHGVRPLVTARALLSRIGP